MARFGVIRSKKDGSAYSSARLCGPHLKTNENRRWCQFRLRGQGEPCRSNDHPTFVRSNLSVGEQLDQGDGEKPTPIFTPEDGYNWKIATSCFEASDFM